MTLRRSFLPAVLTLLLTYSLASNKGYAGDKDSLQPVQTLTVFDGNGKRVGSVLDLAGATASVPIRVNGELVIVSVNHDHIGNVNSNQPQLFFESANCVGPAFSLNPIPAPSLAPNHVLAGTLVYAYDSPTRTIVYRSFNQANNFVNNCQTVGPFQDTAAPLRLLIDLGTQFQPPFTMK